MHAGNRIQFALMLPPLGLHSGAIYDTKVFLDDSSLIFFPVCTLARILNACVVGSLGFGCFLCALASFWVFWEGKVVGWFSAVARS